MGRTHFASTVLALAVGATVANAADVNWTLDGNASWGTDTNWSAPPAWDGSDVLEFSTNTITENRTLTLDGNRTAHSLVGTATQDRTYAINPGDPSNSRLVLTSGNIATTSQSTARTPFDLSGITLQIGPASTAVNATWDQSVGTGNNQITTRVGELVAHAGTVVEVTGTGNAITFTQSSPDFLGTIRVVGNTNRGEFTVNASNGMGAGTVEYSADHGGTRLADGTTHDTSFAFNFSSGDRGTYLYMHANETATINGSLSGTGQLNIGRNRHQTTHRPGTLIFNGDSTFAGPVVATAGTIQINGMWESVGNFTLNSTTQSAGNHLEGIGTVGMASGREVALDAGAETNLTTIAPGTHGTIGVLTIGTEGNDNAVNFNGFSGLRADIDGAASDRLVVIGDLNLAATSRLWINELSSPTAGFYTLATYTGTLDGVFGSVIGLPDGYSIDYSTPGQINLVPEPAALSLLGLGALGLLRRRR